MTLRRLHLFLRNESGAAITVEFVVIMSFFVLISFFVLEIALVQFYWQTAEKAAQIGARLASVSDPAVALTSPTCPAAPASLPLINCKTAAGVYGEDCNDGADACVDYGTITCSGGDGSCNANAFNYIVNRMRQTYLPIQNGNVTISYSYLPALGYAGGPIVPSVTVTLSGVPVKLGVISILGNIIGKGSAPLFQIPAMSATMSGEDLNSSQSSS